MNAAVAYLVPHTHHVTRSTLTQTNLYGGQEFRVHAEGDDTPTIIRIVSVSNTAGVAHVYFSVNGTGIRRLTLDEFYLNYPNRV